MARLLAKAVKAKAAYDSVMRSVKNDSMEVVHSAKSSNKSLLAIKKPKLA